HLQEGNSQGKTRAISTNITALQLIEISKEEINNSMEIDKENPTIDIKRQNLALNKGSLGRFQT
ncbi:1394_t:CDS:1, partial [Dentiscutata heterogama]